MGKMPSKGGKQKAAAAKPGTEKPKRLAPKPEVLRELYLLSGNNCAMPGCDALIIDGNGVVVGHVCHIRAAMPDGARFDPGMTNEQRRAAANLVLMCGGHHTQIDSKTYEDEFKLERVLGIKKDHEANFKGVGMSLRQAFRSQFADTTDALNPTGGHDFAELERVLPDCRLDPDQEVERRKEIADYIARAKLVPDEERDFMLNVIRRAIKLDGRDDLPMVHVDDMMSAYKLGQTRLKRLGEALARYDVGRLDEVGMSSGDEWHILVKNPSDHLTWFDIARFCEKTGSTLDDFVLRLDFGLLAGK